MLNAKLLLSGVKRTSKVVAPMPLLSIQVAKDLEPICRMASTDCWNNREARERMRNTDETEERATLRVRVGKGKRIVPWRSLQRLRMLLGEECNPRSGARFNANGRQRQYHNGIPALLNERLGDDGEEEEGGGDGKPVQRWSTLVWVYDVCGDSFSLKARAGWNKLRPDYSVCAVRGEAGLLFSLCDIFLVIITLCKFGMRGLWTEHTILCQAIRFPISHWTRTVSLHQPQHRDRRIRKLNLCYYGTTFLIKW